MRREQLTLPFRLGSREVPRIAYALIVVELPLAKLGVEREQGGARGVESWWRHAGRCRCAREALGSAVLSDVDAGGVVPLGDVVVPRTNGGEEVVRLVVVPWASRGLVGSRRRRHGSWVPIRMCPSGALGFRVHWNWDADG